MAHLGEKKGAEEGGKPVGFDGAAAAMQEILETHLVQDYVQRVVSGHYFPKAVLEEYRETQRERGSKLATMALVEQTNGGYRRLLIEHMCEALDMSRTAASERVDRKLAELSSSNRYDELFDWMDQMGKFGKYAKAEWN